MKYKAELETQLIKVGNKYKSKFNELHLTKEQVKELYRLLFEDEIIKDRYSGITIFIGEKIK